MFCKNSKGIENISLYCSKLSHEKFAISASKITNNYQQPWIKKKPESNVRINYGKMCL